MEKKEMQEKLKMYRYGASFLEEIVNAINDGRETYKLKDRLCDIKKEIKNIEKVLGFQEFERVAIGKEYYRIHSDGTFEVIKDSEDGDVFDDWCFEAGNYFYTAKDAEKAIDKICFMLMMEKYHSAYCPDYYPDETKEKLFHTVFYDKEIESYVPVTLTVLNGALTYFETKEIAKKVCETLNEKRRVRE